MRNNIFLIAALLVSWPLNSMGNEIYIEQIGDNLDLDITQDGQNNEFGDSVADAKLLGDDMTFNITQTGDTNKIDASINGSDYTGTWVFTGSNNDVELTCDPVGGVKCDNVTLNITTTGDSNIFDVFLGATADASGLIANFTITGDGNVIQTAVDGANADITVTIDSDSNNNSTSTVNDVGTGNSTGSGGNLLDIVITGDGDTNGHKIILDLTGGGNNLSIAQSGIRDNLVDLDLTGDDGDVQIIQSD